MDSQTAANISHSHDNTSAILVKVCLHILGLWTNDKSTVSDNSEEEHFQASTSGRDDAETRTSQERPLEQETQPLLGGTSRRDRATTTTCKSSWHCCFRKVDNYIWIFLPLAVFALLIYDLCIYLRCSWGKRDRVLYLVSYSTYILELAAIPCICLLINIQLRYNEHFSLDLASVFRKDGLLMNSQLAKCRTACMELGQFVLILTWPVVNMSLGVYIYATIEYSYTSSPWIMLLSRITTSVGFLQYGCLAYVCYKLRIASTRRFNNVSDEIASVSENEGKSKICDVYFKYKDFRDFVGYWMFFALTVGILGLTSLLSWHFGYSRINKEPTPSDPMFPYAIMIWSQKLMFILQPLMIFGGVNVDYLWDDFKDNIAKRLMAPETAGMMFHRLMRHMRELNDPPQWINSTLVFTIIGLYFGMQLTDQDYRYWLGPDCHSILTWSNLIVG
ncbi:uncharacterized protein [Amphiura filiformis]|uniref:uncharacterized protein n=1 Tax=Amphiura filiformis TaxID=82378 RepID=UPI003B20E29B